MNVGRIISILLVLAGLALITAGAGVAWGTGAALIAAGLYVGALGVGLWDSPDPVPPEPEET